MDARRALTPLLGLLAAAAVGCRDQTPSPGENIESEQAEQFQPTEPASPEPANVRGEIQDEGEAVFTALAVLRSSGGDGPDGSVILRETKDGQVRVQAVVDNAEPNARYLLRIGAQQSCGEAEGEPAPGAIGAQLSLQADARGHAARNVVLKGATVAKGAPNSLSGRAAVLGTPEGKSAACGEVRLREQLGSGS